MAWDSSRPVPWQRLMREWLVYVGVMAAVFVLLFRDNLAGALAGLLISGPLYLAFGYVLAKFGYQRKSMKDLRVERERAAPSPTSNSAESSDRTSSRGAPRSRPAPTSRTATGRGRPGTKPNRRKR